MNEVLGGECVAPGMSGPDEIHAGVGDVRAVIERASRGTTVQRAIHGSHSATA